MSPTDEAFSVPAPQAAYSTPIDSPLSGPPPARFRDGEVLTVQYRTDPAAIRRLLPEPLVPTNDTVMVQVARYGDVAGLGRDTYEANVMVGARLGELTGCYSPYFWVTSDRAMVGGREFHGQPKRIGSVALEHRGDLIVGTVANNGIEIFTGTLPYKAAPSTFEDVCRRVDLVTNINLKIVHHIDGRTAIRQLTARDLSDIEVPGCWTGPSTAEVRPNATSPLYRLPVLGFLEGFYWHTEFTLVGGRVVHEYEQ
ncbi:MAG TPA: acetoacetate decarboxylase family protein [Acidimicrobiales bacterium]|nr:acetoacetate decarboxylase family protein [Acidimicrobiales bacterium]